MSGQILHIEYERTGFVDKRSDGVRHSGAIRTAVHVRSAVYRTQPRQHRQMLGSVLLVFFPQLAGFRKSDGASSLD